jgi:hypothetical protein
MEQMSKETQSAVPKRGAIDAGQIKKDDHLSSLSEWEWQNTPTIFFGKLGSGHFSICYGLDCVQPSFPQMYMLTS